MDIYGFLTSVVKIMLHHRPVIVPQWFRLAVGCCNPLSVAHLSDIFNRKCLYFSPAPSTHTHIHTHARAHIKEFSGRTHTNTQGNPTEVDDGILRLDAFKREQVVAFSDFVQGCNICSSDERNI